MEMRLEYIDLVKWKANILRHRNIWYFAALLCLLVYSKEEKME